MTSNFDEHLDTARELVAVARRQTPEAAAQTYIRAVDALDFAASTLRRAALEANRTAREVRISKNRERTIAKNRARRAARLAVNAVFGAGNTDAERAEGATS